MAALIGVLLAVLAGLMAAPSIVRSQLAASQTLREITTAQEQVILNDAAATYIQANSASLLATATPSAPVVVSVPTLIAANVLRPATFSATNPYGQTWQVEITQPTAGTLQGLVLGVGGTALSDIQTGAIAKAVGRAGGLIPLNDSGLYPGGAANAYGTAGNWQISTTGYSAISGGHPASLVTLSNGQLGNNYLYRNAVPDQPQVNTMNTDIHMAGNSLDGASSVTAVGVYASEAQTSGTIESGGRLTGDEYVQIKGTATIGASCSSTGLEARNADGSGAPLFCQSGVWAKALNVLTQFTTPTIFDDSTATVDMGVHTFCSLTGAQSPANIDADCAILIFTGPEWFLSSRATGASSGHWCQATCLD
jgi:hypothetical protein